jgi:diacylglycerol kinase (ATP)
MGAEHRQWYFIVNPAAANERVAKIWPRLQPRLMKQFPGSRVVLTEYAGHAIELVEQALREGFTHIAGVGGDGTNHEIINGLMIQELVPRQNITYTLLPIGTGNDWIRTHRIPKKLDAWINMAKQGQIVEHDIGFIDFIEEGEVSTRYFINVAGIGYDGYIVDFATRYKFLVSGKLSYLLLILLGLFRYKLSPATIHFDEQQQSGRFYTLNAGICPYSGGGLRLVPHAKPFDGQLALTIAGHLSKLGVILNTWRFYTGSIGNHPKVSLHQVSNIQVNAAKPLLVEADGEFLGRTPANISLAAEKIRVLVPFRE